MNETWKGSGQNENSKQQRDAQKNARKDALNKPQKYGVNGGLTKEESNSQAVSAPSKSLRKTTIGDTDGDE